MISEKYHSEPMKAYTPKGLGPEKILTRFEQDRSEICEELDSLVNSIGRLETIFSPVLKIDPGKIEGNDILMSEPKSAYDEFINSIKTRLRNYTEKIQMLCERSSL